MPNIYGYGHFVMTDGSLREAIVMEFLGVEVLEASTNYSQNRSQLPSEIANAAMIDMVG